MKNVNRSETPIPARRHERRRPENSAERRFVNAWGDADAKQGEMDARAHPSPWQRVREFSNSRAGRIVMLAPLGAIGAYLLIRRRSKN